MYRPTVFSKVWQYILSHRVAGVVFVFLSILLWQADGQQMPIDGIALSMLMVIAVYLLFRAKALRSVHTIQLVLAGLFFLYVACSLPFSDDIGYSIFLLFRYCVVFLTYGLLYRYSTKGTLRELFYGFFCAGVVALCISVCVPFKFQLLQWLPVNTLLYAASDHHPFISLLLFLYPVCFISWVETRKTVALVGAVVFFLASVATFSRAGVSILFVCSLLYLLYTGIRKKTVRTFHIVIIGFIAALCVLLFAFPYTPTNTALTMISRQQKTSDITGARLEYIRQAAQSFLERPLFGSGLGTFLLQSLRLEKKVFAFTLLPHSIVMQYLSDLGMIGTILLSLFLGSVFFSVFRALRNEKKPAWWIPAGMCVLGAVISFSLVDIPFFYLTIVLMFWAILGAFGGLQDIEVPHAKHAIFFCVFSFFLCAAAWIGYADSWFFWRENGVPVCNPIRAKQVAVCLKEANLKQHVFSSSYRAVVELLHKKQRLVLLPLAVMEEQAGNRERAIQLYDTALLYDPFSADTYYPYFHFLARTQQYQQLGTVLTRASVRILPSSLAGDIQRLALGAPEYYAAYDQVFASSTVSGYALLYYQIGLYLLPTSPNRTEVLWRLANIAYPGYGRLYVERANLLEYTFHDPDGAKKVLLDCQSDAAAAGECRERMINGVAEPGSLQAFITAGK